MGPDLNLRRVLRVRPCARVCRCRVRTIPTPTNIQIPKLKHRPLCDQDRPGIASGLQLHFVVRTCFTETQSSNSRGAVYITCLSFARRLARRGPIHSCTLLTLIMCQANRVVFESLHNHDHWLLGWDFNSYYKSPRNLASEYKTLCIWKNNILQFSSDP
jgi:hypothetical protein